MILTPYIGYRVVAYVLLGTVSLTAMSFDIWPVVLTAVLSAVVWDFLFIPPVYTFHVGSAEDMLLLSMYFVVALINAVLTIRIRQVEKNARLKEKRAGAIKLYNTFLNSLSHELRTPISTIIAATDTLQSSGSLLKEPQKEELLHEISKASIRLNDQVENLLNMSRLESGFLQPKPDWVDVDELIYGIVDKVQELYPERQFDIQLGVELPLVKIDKGMMEHVIFNLLKNACIYTPGNEKIQVKVQCRHDVLEVRVADKGPGFPQEEIHRVFDKFYRLQDTKPGGTGLGLSIVKGFVSAMGGSVTLENIVGGGALFTIKMQVATNYLKQLKNE